MGKLLNCGITYLFKLIFSFHFPIKKLLLEIWCRLPFNSHNLCHFFSGHLGNKDHSPSGRSPGLRVTIPTPLNSGMNAGDEINFGDVSDNIHMKINYYLFEDYA